MPYFNIVVESNEATVVTTYEPVIKKAEAYQSEAALEAEFIHLLQEQSYEYLPIHNETELINNLRIKLEELNNYTFTDKEWDRFFNLELANPNLTIVDKTRMIQESDTAISLKLDNGENKNIRLLDKVNIHNNKLQVINQYVVTKEDGAKYDNRYDVTILVNGLPLVHIELKRRGVQIKEAFNQINRYDRDSFWAGSGLFNYVQIFVISNGTNTKYYSNSTRYYHVKNETDNTKKDKTSNTFEFTSYWADANSKVIPDLVDFTKTFFAKHTILSILTRYCVFDSDNNLLVMRPYQIVATERILNRIEIANNYKKYGSIEAGGYIWHTTGSGKTLTSFKAARLASRLPYISKVLFVVDRKDLDYQTMREYDRFEEGAANSNTSTAILKKQLENQNSKIIITTIQKLSTFVKKNLGHSIFNEPVVLIFDECHRSQFGEMHSLITKYFKKYYIFGFTGTPIFAVNSGTSKEPTLRTTEQVFGDQLHTYTIVNAINDENVLPFHVDYIKTIDKDPEIDDKKVWDINREAVFMDKRRIANVVKYIIEHFNEKTYRNEKSYSFAALKNIAEVAGAKKTNPVDEIKEKTHLSGFNSIFAVSSIEMAKLYYNEFKKQMAELPEYQRLKLGIIYSYGANEEEVDGILDEENPEDTTRLDQQSRDFLESAIQEYNELFHVNYSTDSDGFQRYYKDVSLRMKNKQLDLLIVVNMFLTGFDATTLNTLWVDKNLKMHGLIQAFSRTNRILNSVKKHGNIVCFRNLAKRTEAAIALFGDKNAAGIVLLKSFKDYYEGYDDSKGNHKKGYKEMIVEIQEKYPITEQIILIKDKKEFVALFGAILRMKNLLSSFDDFKGKEILSEIEFQDFCSRYLDIREELKKEHKDPENINDDVIFEMDLIKHIEVNIDYILMLVAKYHDGHCSDKEVLITIQKTLDASPDLRSKKALIEGFIEGINDVDDVMTEWHNYIAEEKEKELVKIINEENLKEVETREFIDASFRDGQIKTTGTDIEKILPPMSHFGSKRAEKKKSVLKRLIEFFDRFFGI